MKIPKIILLVCLVLFPLLSTIGCTQWQEITAADYLKSIGGDGTFELVMLEKFRDLHGSLQGGGFFLLIVGGFSVTGEIKPETFLGFAVKNKEGVVHYIEWELSRITFIFAEGPATVRFRPSQKVLYSKSGIGDKRLFDMRTGWSSAKSDAIDVALMQPWSFAIKEFSQGAEITLPESLFYAEIGRRL